MQAANQNREASVCWRYLTALAKEVLSPLFSVFILSMPSKVIMIVKQFMFLGINIFWALLRARLNPCFTARAKMSLSRAQNMFMMSANINSVVSFYSAGLFSLSSTVTTKQGKNVTLRCGAVAKGGVWYRTTWFNDSQKLITVTSQTHSKYTQRLVSVVDSKSIRLYKVNRYDHGTYSCRALYVVDGKLAPVTEDVELNVKGKLTLLKHLIRGCIH